MKHRFKALTGAVASVVFAVALAAGPAASSSGNNMYNFENGWSDGHSADDSHEGWTLLGGWNCNGLLHDSMEDGHVPNSEHECDTGPD